MAGFSLPLGSYLPYFIVGSGSAQFNADPSQGLLAGFYYATPYDTINVSVVGTQVTGSMSSDGNGFLGCDWFSPCTFEGYLQLTSAVPVPEPATGLLLLTALGALAGVKRMAERIKSPTVSVSRPSAGHVSGQKSPRR